MIIKLIFFIYFNIIAGIHQASIDRNLDELRQLRVENKEIKETLVSMHILLMTHKEFLQIICLKLADNKEEKQSEYRLE